MKNVPAYLAERLFKSMKVNHLYHERGVPKIHILFGWILYFGHTIQLFVSPVVWKGMLSHCFIFVALKKMCQQAVKQITCETCESADMAHNIQFIPLLSQTLLCPGCRDNRVHSDQDNNQSLRDRLVGHQSRVQEAVWIHPLLPVRGQDTHPHS